MSLRNEMTKLASDGGGSNKTRADRMKIVRHIVDILHLKKNIQVRTVQQLKVKHIEQYISHRLAEGISRRTLQNEMAALRKVLTQAGREDFARHERLTNKSLQLAGDSREGSKHAISPDKYHKALRLALQRDKGLAATLMLARHLGLRSEEAVQATKSLGTWSSALKEGRNSIHVIYGTKGGRPRHVYIHNSMRTNIERVFQFALKVAEGNDGKLINKPTLKSAMDRFHNQARDIGLVGIDAPHSLRYAFARDQIKHYEENGLSHAEALAATACDLGHGDGRGRYVERVYTK